jgi:hypothetical protein
MGRLGFEVVDHFADDGSETETQLKYDERIPRLGAN